MLRRFVGIAVIQYMHARFKFVEKLDLAGPTQKSLQSSWHIYWAVMSLVFFVFFYTTYNFIYTTNTTYNTNMNYSAYITYCTSLRIH